MWRKNKWEKMGAKTWAKRKLVAAKIGRGKKAKKASLTKPFSSKFLRRKLIKSHWKKSRKGGGGAIMYFLLSPQLCLLFCTAEE